jgi:predicted dehydrogenase
MRAAVIGTGRIAAQHLACLRSLPGVEIAALCDVSPAAAEATAERFGVARWFTDHRALLAETRPDVVHVTTPPASHFAIARDALEAGHHVLVEKPITTSHADLDALGQLARARARWLVEDQNYLFNPPVVELRRLVESGELGEVVHLEAFYCLGIGPRSAASGRGVPGGAIGHFLSHLACLSHAFVGAHRDVHAVWMNRSPELGLGADELRALVRGERATALLGFSAHARPDAFLLRVHGSRMRASANLFEGTLVTERADGPAPLVPLRNAWREGLSATAGAARSLLGKLRGEPGAYAGLHELVRRLYAGLERGQEPPVSWPQIEQVTLLVGELARTAPRGAPEAS